MPTPLEDYLFDLQGYLLLKGAVSADHVARLNAGIDVLRPLGRREWRGGVYNEAGGGADGDALMNIFEAGEAFDELIDHPSWLGRVDRYVGAGCDGLFIDEAFALVRGPGTGTNLHSGGEHRRLRTQFRFHNGQFRCGQVNILLALTDIGPGDGATMVIPGSHKSNLPHPQFAEMARPGESLDDVHGAVELHCRAGDALLFVDCIAHGSARRVNPGERRILIYRYGPGVFAPRFGYVPRQALLDRLTPRRRKILQPIPPMYAPEER